MPVGMPLGMSVGMPERPAGRVRPAPSRPGAGRDGCASRRRAPHGGSAGRSTAFRPRGVVFARACDQGPFGPPGRRATGEGGAPDGTVSGRRAGGPPRPPPAVPPGCGDRWRCRPTVPVPAGDGPPPPPRQPQPRRREEVRAGQHRGGRPGAGAGGREQRRVVGPAQGEVHVVGGGGHDDRGAVRARPVEGGEQPLLAVGVEARRRFVEDQDAGPHGDRARDRRPPPRTAARTAVRTTARSPGRAR